MVKRVIAFARQFGLIAAIGITAAIVISLSEHIKRDQHSDFDSFQGHFSKLESKLDVFTKKALHCWITDGETGMLEEYKEAETDASFFLHIFRNDSLIFWNTNQLPVYSFAELHFPVEGMVRLQNGWYYTKILKRGRLLIVGSVLVQHGYPYENEQLQNNFNILLSKSSGTISLDPGSIEVHNNAGKFLFSIQPVPENARRDVEETGLFFGIVILAILIWLQVVRWSPGIRSRIVMLVIFTVLRFWCLKSDWLSGLASSELFDPTILALGEWTPDFGELILSFFLFLFFMNTLIIFIRAQREPTRFSKITTFILMLAFPVLFWWMGSVGQQIVENSSIPLQLDQLFSLTIYSLDVLTIVGIAGFSYVVLYYELTRAFLRTGWNKFALGMLCAWTSLVYVVVCLWFETNWNAIVWPILLNGTIAVSVLREGKKWNFSFILLLLLLFSVGATSSFHAFSQTKEHAERELYANQLADDRDINTEIEYLTTKKLLLNEPYLQRLSSLKDRPNPSALKEALERRIFNGFWERYDIDFYYYDRTDTITKFNGRLRKDFENLINRHGLVSEMDSSVFLIKDYTSQYSYVIREQLGNGPDGLWLYLTLKSKKIPEEIGFPRLLISDKAKVFESLETYSIAKYYKGKLVNRYGVYSFPYSADVLKETAAGKKRFFNKGDYNHFMLKRGNSDMIILSREDSDWIDGVTTMAFLFVSYGILLAFYSWMQARNKRLAFRRLSLAVKIQVVLVGLVFLSLLGFSIGSGTFVKNQYEQYTDDVIREKLRSVGTVGKIRLGPFEDIGAARRGDMEYYLRNWSQIFVTDVNVYDLRGQLVGSSRPKIYNIGLLSEQMNPLARKALVFEKKSEYIHQERIGNLKYLSGYIPFFNDEGNLIAYLNIQHFDQQNEFESQIQLFLVAIINVFMILLALSIVGAIFVSNWLTSPLRMIQRSFSRMELGKSNQAIDYQSNDELGDLVREYNQKLVDLDTAAQKLAQSERESAWREMAKQVAHEIKNPLTPMKLSIQQLQRVFDPNDPNSKNKIDRVAQSIIEQIDALTSIANAFANFAKMPQPKVERLELRSFLESLVAVFEAQDSCKVQLFASLDEVYIQGDKEMLLRVINNVVTNGIQAIPPSRKGKIRIILTADEQHVTVDVTDNGSGIPEEQLATVFEPYFTTKSTGTGLGLAMVKQIVEGHGGTIVVQRTDSTGTTMLITFPRVS